jgi:hypothetical protein
MADVVPEDNILTIDIVAHDILDVLLSKKAKRLGCRHG